MPELNVLLPLVAGLAAAGLLAGLVAGLLGVGGGIVMVPAMGLAFAALGLNPDIYQHVAVGTSLAVIIATGFFSARAHYQRGAVMMDILKVWGPFIVIGSLAGGLLSRFFSGDGLRLVFGFVVLAVAVNMALPFLERILRPLRDSAVAHRVLPTLWGFISALMGIGGGSLSVPTLVAFGHSMHKAVGTSAALGLILAIPGTFGFVVSGWGVEGRPPLSFGYINLPALLVIGVLASLVAPYGAKLAHRLDAKALRGAFGLFLLAVGLRMIWQAWM